MYALFFFFFPPLFFLKINSADKRKRAGRTAVILFTLPPYMDITSSLSRSFGTA